MLVLQRRVLYAGGEQPPAVTNIHIEMPMYGRWCLPQARTWESHSDTTDVTFSTVHLAHGCQNASTRFRGCTTHCLHFLGNSYSAGRVFHGSTVPFWQADPPWSTHRLHSNAQETWVRALPDAGVRRSDGGHEFDRSVTDSGSDRIRPCL
jgi:hypothetical protein